MFKIIIVSLLYLFLAIKVVKAATDCHPRWAKDGYKLFCDNDGEGPVCSFD